MRIWIKNFSSERVERQIYQGSDKCDYGNHLNAFYTGCGEIGIHVTLRMLCRKACGFESHHPDDKQLKVVKRFGVKLKSRLCDCAYQSLDLVKNLSGHT